MYTAIGTYPDGREAALEYATLDEALQKLRDWAEADELDDDPGSPMFIRYALTTPKSASGKGKPQQGADAQGHGNGFELRLVE